MDSIKGALHRLVGSLICILMSAAIGGVASVLSWHNQFAWFLAVVAIILFVAGFWILGESIGEIIRLLKQNNYRPKKLKGKAVKTYQAKICGREFVYGNCFNVIVRYFDHRGWKKEAWIKVRNNGRWGEEYRVGGTVHIKADDEYAEFDSAKPQVTEEEFEWHDRLMKEDVTCYQCRKQIRMTAGTAAVCPNCGRKTVLPSIRSYTLKPEDNPQAPGERIVLEHQMDHRKVYVKSGIGYKEVSGANGFTIGLVFFIIGAGMLYIITSANGPLGLRVMLGLAALAFVGNGVRVIYHCFRDLSGNTKGPRFRGKIFAYDRDRRHFEEGIPAIMPVVRYFDSQGQINEAVIETGSIAQHEYAIGNTVDIEVELSGANMVMKTYPRIKHKTLPDENRLMDEAEGAKLSGKRGGVCMVESDAEAEAPVRLECQSCESAIDVIPGSETNCPVCGRKLAFTFDKIAIWDSQTII